MAYTSGAPDSFDEYASHFPSGENLGRALREFRPHENLRLAVSVHREHVDIGAVLRIIHLRERERPAVRRPRLRALHRSDIGQQLGGPLRSAGIHHIVIVPVFQERNVSRLPSGVHDGQWLAPSKLIFVNPPRAKSYMKMSCDAPSTSIASSRPSGESLGEGTSAAAAATATSGHSYRPRPARVCPFFRAGGVDQMPVARNGIRGHSRVRAHEEAVGDGKRLTGDFELDVERHGQELSCARVNQMARRRVARTRPSLNENLLFPVSSDSTPISASSYE